MNKILVYDMGSRFTSDVIECIESLNVEVKKVDYTFKADEIEDDIKGIVITGSKDNISDGSGFRTIDEKVYELNIPIMGICYGHQLTNYLLGGKVIKASVPEQGERQLEVIKQSPIFKGMDKIQNVMMYHNDEVEELGKGLEIIAKTKDCKVAACHNLDKKIFVLQFHPEAEHSEHGLMFFKNFIQICGL